MFYLHYLYNHLYVAAAAWSLQSFWILPPYGLQPARVQRDYKLFNEEELRIDTLKAVSMTVLLTTRLSQTMMERDINYQLGESDKNNWEQWT